MTEMRFFFVSDIDEDVRCLFLDLFRMVTTFFFYITMKGKDEFALFIKLGIMLSFIEGFTSPIPYFFYFHTKVHDATSNISMLC